MLKDDLLNRLIELGANTAQFFSIGPGGNLRHVRIQGFQEKETTVENALRNLLEKSPSVNIRMFTEDRPDGHPFIYGKTDFDEILGLVTEYTSKGYFVIVNETIDINDGGISGVFFGERFEGAPHDTPRCVESSGCMEMPKELMLRLIETVYGFYFRMPFVSTDRVECSIHPHGVGYFGQRQIIWQRDTYPKTSLPFKPSISWPNRYSSLMGDKAFGLLIAHLLHLPVPRTKVVGRHIPVFEFGYKINNTEPLWIRTAPKVQDPGRFLTRRKYEDPWNIMKNEDPDGTLIASIIIQDGIEAKYSGVCSTGESGEILIEGCEGFGDGYMLGGEHMSELPEGVRGHVRSLCDRLKNLLGDTRFEWVFDGERAWIVQLHCGKISSSTNVIYSGEPSGWRDFEAKLGLEELRRLVAEVKGKDIGIRVLGNFGVLSHIGDILRKNKIPSYRIQGEK